MTRLHPKENGYLIYRLDEIRQQVVFYYNLYYHYFHYGRKFDKNGIECNDYDVNNRNDIPKVIHYCWFGNGKMDEKLQKCMASWKKVLPEYEQVLWNEENFPFDKYPFALQALKDKKWAFVSDVCRLHALYYYGGIYMDTDVEVLKPIDEFLHHGFFSSYESKRQIPTALMGAKKHNYYVKLLLDWYIDHNYGQDFYEIANTRIITKITQLCCNLHLDGKKYQFGDCCYYPNDFFCPERVGEQWMLTENSCSIHHVTGAWGN